MGEHLHGINLHLSAYPPVSDIESLIKTAIKSMNFFIRNSTIKFVFPCNKEKKNTKAKKNISELCLQYNTKVLVLLIWKCAALLKKVIVETYCTVSITNLDKLYLAMLVWF